MDIELETYVDGIMERQQHSARDLCVTSPWRSHQRHRRLSGPRPTHAVCLPPTTGATSDGCTYLASYVDAVMADSRISETESSHRYAA